MRIGTSRLVAWMSWCTLALLTVFVPSRAHAADPLAVRVYTDKAQYTRGEQALLTLEVTNTSSLAVTTTTNGQQYDFEARDANGTTVWTWSHGKSFDGTSTVRVLGPGETYRVQETWAFVDDAGAGVLDGTYTVSGSYFGEYIGRSGPKVATQDVSLFTPDPLQVTFSADKSAYSRFSKAALSLTVTNVAAYPVTIDFQNGQHYEFTAKNASGQVVWTWSLGKTFTPDAESVVLAPGESLVFGEAWSFSSDNGLPLMDGNYTVGGTFLGQYYGAVPPKGGEAQVRLYTLF